MSRGVGTAVINFPASPGSNTASVVVSGIPEITSGSSVSVFLMAEATADHNEVEHEIADIALRCGEIVPGVGFTIHATSVDRLTGNFKVRYAWSSP